MKKKQQRTKIAISNITIPASFIASMHKYGLNLHIPAVDRPLSIITVPTSHAKNKA